MHTLDEVLESNRKARVKRLLEYIKSNEGIRKDKLFGEFSFMHGLKKRTIYKYLEVLEATGAVVEEDYKGIKFIWSKEGFDVEERERREREAKQEEEMTKNISLDAYQMEGD